MKEVASNVIQERDTVKKTRRHGGSLHVTKRERQTQSMKTWPAQLLRNEELLDCSTHLTTLAMFMHKDAMSLKKKRMTEIHRVAEATIYNETKLANWELRFWTPIWTRLLVKTNSQAQPMN